MNNAMKIHLPLVNCLAVLPRVFRWRMPVSGVIVYPWLGRAVIMMMLGVVVSGCAPRTAMKFAESTKTDTIKRECAATDKFPSFLLSQHVLVSDSQGSIPDDRFDGRFSKAFLSIMTGYSDAVRANPDNPPRLLFYFNGGLNSQADVEAQAESQVPCMMADGYYPVFFVWDTGFFNSYGEQVTHVWNGFYSNDWYTYPQAPFRVGSDVVSGIAHAPLDLMVEGQRFSNALFREPKCSLRVRGAPSYCRDKFIGKPDDDETGSKLKGSKLYVDPIADEPQREIVKFLSYAALYPVRLVATPIAHGFGGTAWQNFLRRTRTTIRKSWEYRPNLATEAEKNQKRIIEKSYPNGSGVFARFFEALRQYKDLKGHRLLTIALTDNPEGKTEYDVLCPQDAPEKFDPLCQPDRIVKPDSQGISNEAITSALQNAKITLIGHSMGGIVVNELVEKFPDLPYSDIVVMASAASVRDTQRVMNHYYDAPLKPKDTRFFSLMLHPLNDARERQALGAIPSGSLLPWIDEMYEVPKTPGDRTFGYWPNIKAARDMFSQKAQKKTLYRIFNRQDAKVGDVSNPVEHGDFNDDGMCFWRPGFWGADKLYSSEDDFREFREAYKGLTNLAACRKQR